jgi:two-component system sensor histidine kinase SenX3
MTALGWLVALVAVTALVVGTVLARRSRARDRAEFERAVAHAEEGRAASAADAARLVRALGAIRQGVVVWDDEGREVLRNDVAATFAGARHAEALVEQAVRTQLEGALQGAPSRRTLDLFGPPPRLIAISAVAVEGGAVAVIEDVSERRRLDAVRRDFVANISHELKTPVGALGLLAETIADEPDAAVSSRLAERMTVEAFRVARIIDDLLDLSRIEAEEVPERELVSVHELVTEATDRVRGLAQARRIVIEAEGVVRRHAVLGDRRQLVSAIGNLLENACKYSDEGSSIEVRTRADGTWVELSVSDHGVGIPSRDLERVFERFYRVDRARSRETGGTGLGLAIVRHVASNHAGDVRVESREGEGSTFTLRLPAGPGVVALEDAG